MALNIRNKGAGGEREICELMNRLTAQVLLSPDHNITPPAVPLFQRNQNQTAVGGADITNPFELCIEVKRHETLQVNQWWEQCTTAAKRFGGIPILMYRQNGKRKWNVVMYGMLPCPDMNRLKMFRMTLEQQDFEQWFKDYLDDYLRKHDVFECGVPK